MFFNFRDSSEFYYVHLASKADQNAHNVFIVNQSPRTNIAKQTTDGIRWIDNHWHHVRLERISSTGSIKVFFDDMENPVMVAENDLFKTGLLGVGSFDDSGKIDNIEIWSPDFDENGKSVFNRKKQ